LKKINDKFGVLLDFFLNKNIGSIKKGTENSILVHGNNIKQSINEIKCLKELDDTRKKIIELQEKIINMQDDKLK
jgi:hypothetical protein